MIVVLIFERWQDRVKGWAWQGELGELRHQFKVLRKLLIMFAYLERPCIFLSLWTTTMRALVFGVHPDEAVHVPIPLSPRLLLLYIGCELCM